MAVAVGAVSAAMVLLAATGWWMLRTPVLADRLAGAGSEAQPSGQTRSGRGTLVGGWYRRLAAALQGPAVALTGRSRLERTRHRLEAAGRPDGLDAEEFVGRKAAFTLAGAAAGLVFLLRGSLIPAVLLAAGGFVWMELWLSSLVRARQRDIQQDLPDFLDILVVTVQAGMGFLPALERVAGAFSGPLSEEITTVLRQLRLGESRRVALEALRERNDSESLSEFVTALLQAEELGAPLADTLTELAGDLRRDFEQDARRRAARAAPRISVIVATTIVPGAMILIVAAIFLGADVDPGLFSG